MRKALVIGCILLQVVSAGSGRAVPIKLGDNNGDNENPHNFSNRYTGSTKTIYAANTGDPRETQICIFCHTPHGATPESTLWNRPNSPTVFPTYGSALGIYGIAAAQYTSGTTQPSGASKLCLSCHDGITAVGAVVNDGLPIAMVQATITNPNKYFGVGGRNFAATHPVSFVYTGDSPNCTTSGTVCYQLNQLTPGQYTYPTDMTYLDGNLRVQCTSCHNPHLDTNDGTYTLPFWRGYASTGTESQHYDNVCKQCHTSTPGGFPPTGIH